MLKRRQIIAFSSLIVFLCACTFVFATVDAAPINTKQNQQVLEQTEKLATFGRVINSEQFGLGSDKNDILAKWGAPEETDGYFLFYKKRGVLFSTDEAKVNQVMSYDQRLQAITLKEVKKTLGAPVDEYNTEGVHLLYYQTGRHQLWFQSPIPTQHEPNPKLQSVTVN